MLETKITFTLNSLVALLNSRADAILRARFDMTYSQFHFLIALKGRSMSMTELSDCLGVSLAAVSKRSPWFQERGLVRIDEDPGHGRRMLLSLTPKGQRLVDKAATELDRTFVERFVGYEGRDLASLNVELNRVMAHLAHIPKEGS